MSVPIRRQDRAISKNESFEILSRGEFGVLSMSASDGSAYGVPLNFALWNGAIYFHSAMEGAKLTFLKVNNRVSFCVVGKTEVLPAQFGTKYESVILFGAASEVEGEEKMQALMQLVQKYSPGLLAEGIQYIEKLGGQTKVMRISIDHISGKARRS